MTGILYDGANLHADRNVVLPVPPNVMVRSEVSKLTLAQNNTFAYGTAGVLYPEDIKPSVDRLFTQLTRKLITNTVMDRIRLFDVVPEFKKINPETIIKLFAAEMLLITRSQGFLIEPTNESFLSDFGLSAAAASSIFKGKLSGPMVCPATGHVAAIGTGGPFLRGAYAVTEDAKEAYRITHCLEPLTGDEFDTILASSLDPIVIGE